MQCIAAAELFAVKLDQEMSGLYRFFDRLGFAVLFGNVAIRAAVPDQHRSGTVFAFGNHALEVGVFQRVVFGGDCHAFFGRVSGRALGHRP